MADKKPNIFRRAADAIKEKHAATGKQHGWFYDVIPLAFAVGVHLTTIRAALPFGAVLSMYLLVATLCALLYRNPEQGFVKEWLVYVGFAFISVFWWYAVTTTIHTIPFLNDIDVGGRTIAQLVMSQLKWFPLFMILMFNRANTWARDLFNWYVIFFIVGLTLLYSFNMINTASWAGERATIEDTGGNLFKMSLDGITTASSTWIRTVMGWPGMLANNVSKYYDPYFYGTVEKSKTDKQLGVYLKNLEPATETILPEDGNVVVYADVVAKTFTGEILLTNTCYAKYNKNTTKDRTITILAGDVDLKTLNIHDLEENTLTCTIPRQPIQTKDATITVVFNSTFNFNTWGYIDYAFMNRQELRNRQASGKDVARELGLKSGTVTAIYTMGPVNLGLVRQADPPKLPYGLDTEKPVLPLFGVTIENNPAYKGRGQILKIHKLVFHIPKPITIDKESCTPIKNPEEGEDPLNPDIYTIYTFTDVPVRRDADYQTLRCRLNIDPGAVNDFLGQGGIALATFAVEANYDYEITEDVSIKVDKGT